MVIHSLFLGVFGIAHALAGPGPSDVYQIHQSNAGFTTWIRVEIPTKVVEAEDPSILGESTTYTQSLSYTGSKDLAFSGVFSTESELRIKIQNFLCPEFHDIELRPIREGGTKGGRLFKQKIRPSVISVSGTLLSNGKSKPYSTTVTCIKR